MQNSFGHLGIQLAALFEGAVHAFEAHHHLIVAVAGQGVVLDHLRDEGHAVGFPDFLQNIFRQHKASALAGRHLHVGVEGLKDLAVQILHAVEHRQNHDHCHCPYTHANHGNEGDDADKTALVVREKIAPGNPKG